MSPLIFIRKTATIISIVGAFLSLSVFFVDTVGKR
jgi:hypothetical protein